MIKQDEIKRKDQKGYHVHYLENERLSDPIDCNMNVHTYALFYDWATKTKIYKNFTFLPTCRLCKFNFSTFVFDIISLPTQSNIANLVLKK